MSEREPVDREQIRRYATDILEDRPRPRYPEPWNADRSERTTLARHCLALLAELEQAERRAKAGDAAHERMHAAEARLAKVLALVDLLRELRNYFVGFDIERTDGKTSPAITKIDEALTAWESPQ